MLLFLAPPTSVFVRAPVAAATAVPAVDDASDVGGRETFDAQRTAGNTNDLRGKILQITPQPDRTYTIPEGNLFPPDEYDQDLSRPEIYVMGARKPVPDDDRHRNQAVPQRPL